jgi:hypothetical protein
VRFPLDLFLQLKERMRKVMTQNRWLSHPDNVYGGRTYRDTPSRLNIHD